MTGPAIEFRNISKSFRTITALSGVSFEVAHGEVCAFLGPNGAGKTTSINVLMGFLYADSGEVLVLGHLPGDVRAKRQIGFLPENFAFYKHLNAPELLRFHVRLAGLGAEGDTLVPELLRKVKLYGYEELKIGKYSRGMVQRLGIAQALLSDPQLLVLDEPTSGLDPAGRKEVCDLILSLKAAGKTIFLSSHLLAEVEQTCDRVIIIDRGRVVRGGGWMSCWAATIGLRLWSTICPDCRAVADRSRRRHCARFAGCAADRGRSVETRRRGDAVGGRMRRDQPQPCA